MPTRLIDIGTEDGRVKLRSSKDIYSKSAPYICLSYCWGTEEPLKLLKDGKDNFFSEIPWNDLPLTFQNAITVSRNLGVSYLWIDSLCIVQDDPQDFRHEASQMALVYGQACLVIAASKSKSLSDGLFSTPDPPVCSVPLPSSGEDDNDNVLFARKKPLHIPGLTDYFNEEFTTFVTLQRAWIFQERMLAISVLHFGPDELAWECLQETVCECAPEQSREPVAPIGYTTPRDRFYLPYDISWRPKLYHQISYWQAVDEEYLSWFWFNLVEKYSELQLTYRTDSLLAFSGVATEFSKAAKSRYVAGLWERTLIRDLCWQRAAKHSGGIRLSTPLHPSLARSQPHGAFRRDIPSWSWASASSRVNYDSGPQKLTSYCLVVDINCSADFNPTGTLDDASITILGHVFTTTAWVQFAEYYDEKERVRLHALGDIEHKFIVDGHLIQDVKRMIEDNAVWTCLILGVNNISEDNEKRQDEYIVLMLLEIDPDGSEPAQPRFLRVGLATVTNQLHAWEERYVHRPSEDMPAERTHTWKRNKRIRSEDIWSTGFMGVEIRTVTIL